MTMSRPPCIAFIGSAGMPNRYGGFESFVEQTAPAIAARGWGTVVTCDAKLYPERPAMLRGVSLRYIGTRANGPMSTVHDMVAFWHTFRHCEAVIVLGVSAGPFFPLMRLLADMKGVRLLVNVDGVEWRRSKFGVFRRGVLRLFDWLAQRCAHHIVYDNPALLPFVLPGCRGKASYIAYPGDHILRLPEEGCRPGTALTICRIEPENNLDMLISGALASSLRLYTVIGNWNASEYGRELRRRHAQESRLALLDPDYDAESVARHRERCHLYIHGHSVGGTNPSLVEMMFYDATILCFDCAFNRETANDRALYFSDAATLASTINESLAQPRRRWTSPTSFTADRIAQAYIAATGLNHDPR